VPVGTYVVKAALSGFKTTSLRPIALEAKQIARVDLRMEVGALEDTVEVTAQSPVLQTETATRREVLSGADRGVAPAERAATPASSRCSSPGAVTPNPQAQTASGGYSAEAFRHGNRDRRTTSWSTAST